MQCSVKTPRNELDIFLVCRNNPQLQLECSTEFDVCDAWVSVHFAGERIVGERTAISPRSSPGFAAQIVSKNSELSVDVRGKRGYCGKERKKSVKIK